MYTNKSINTISGQKFIIVHNDTLIHLNYYCGCGFVLFFVCVYLRLRIFLQPKSIAGVLFDSVRRFQAPLLLRTTCMHLCGNRVANCVAAWQTKNQKKNMHELVLFVPPYCNTNTSTSEQHSCVQGRIIRHREASRDLPRLISVSINTEGIFVPPVPTLKGVRWEKGGGGNPWTIW